MTPEEHQLIADLFERMRSFGAVEKDREAEAFINQAVRSTPDSAYKLVQSVLVQENALQEAGTRIQDLEDQLAQMQSQLQARPQAASGGFLGGLFGGNKAAQPAPMPMQRPTSGVPITGARAAASPWGGQQQPIAGAGYQQQPMMGQPQQRAGGGFMKTAMATAAGVAGGMLVAGAIKDMMGNNQAQAATPRDGDAASPYEVANTAADPANAPQYQDPASNDPGTYQEDTAGQEDAGGGWFGGGGGGSDDSEF